MPTGDPARLDDSSLVQYPNRRGRLELWSARTEDGAWDLERSEETGTPWIATRRVPPYQGRSVYFGSKTKALRAIGNGTALQELADNPPAGAR